MHPIETSQFFISITRSRQFIYEQYINFHCIAVFDLISFMSMCHDLSLCLNYIWLSLLIFSLIINSVCSQADILNFFTFARCVESICR